MGNPHRGRAHRRRAEAKRYEVEVGWGTDLHVKLNLNDLSLRVSVEYSGQFEIGSVWLINSQAPLDNQHRLDQTGRDPYCYADGERLPPSSILEVG
jgi:hypothetical protein